MKAKKRSPLWTLQNRGDKNGNCEKCGELSYLTVDHIFPVDLLLRWGIKEQGWEDGDNLQLICHKCQTLKGSNFDFHNSKTIPLIEKYINLIKDIYK